MSALRAELKSWIERARDGEDVVITDRGVPVARLSAVAGADLVAGLLRDGVLTAPDEPRPAAQGAAQTAARGRDAMSGLVRRLRR